MTDSDRQRAGDEGAAEAKPAAGWTLPGGADAPAGDDAAGVRRTFPGAAGPPRSEPPTWLSSQRLATPQAPPPVWPPGPLPAGPLGPGPSGPHHPGPHVAGPHVAGPAPAGPGPRRVLPPPMSGPMHYGSAPPMARYGPPPPSRPPSVLVGAPPNGGVWEGAVRPPRFLAQQAAARSITRPSYREPLPVRGGAVASGAGIGALWMLLWGVQAGSLVSYLVLTGIAAILGWAAAAVLVRYGDRGMAVGGAGVAAIGSTIAAIAALVHFV